MKKSPAKLLRDLCYLREEGFNIPEDMLTYVRWQDWKQRHIIQVWECTCQLYESELRIKGMLCSNGHEMKLSWFEVDLTDSQAV